MNHTERKIRPDIPTTTSLLLNYIRSTVRELANWLPFSKQEGRN
jgi:hypothetical protein